MLVLSILLVAAAVASYVLSPSQLLHSEHPLPFYALMLGAAVAAARLRRRARIAMLLVVVLLSSSVFYVHSVRSRTESGEVALALGERFPEVTLPTSTGTVFSSADLRGRSAALYVFYRGDWCPFCRTELGALEQYYARIRMAGVELFAVSVDPPEASERLRQKLGVPFTFVSDGDGSLLDRLGIRHRAGHDGKDIAYPAQVLVDRDGIVRWTFRADSYRQRARPEEILAAIAGLLR